MSTGYDGPHCVGGTDYEDEPTGFRTPRQTPCTDVEGSGECHHCPCCCDCMGCLYGPRDGMLLTEEQRAPIAAHKSQTEDEA